MCGRYALALRPAQIRRMFREDNMPVDEPPDDSDDENENENGGDGGDDGPRQSYNFAPGYRGVVYRADVPDWGAGPRSRHGREPPTDADDSASSPRKTVKEEGTEADLPQTSTDDERVRYKLQTMKWGLIPFWNKQNVHYSSISKTINCRDDSLAQRGGMWSSMKARKRCIVVAQGFYEWLKKDGGRVKTPHYVKRKDGKLMCFAGLWDVVLDENGEKRYTYTIITTDSNRQLKFLHDRMPVILENGSEKISKWLDPKRYEWSNELQSLLAPYDGELEVYPVSKDVGKVGNDSPTFIIPVYSKENKSNIANFFTKSTKKGGETAVKEEPPAKDTVTEESQPDIRFRKDEGFVADSTEDSRIKIEAEAITAASIGARVKREADVETSAAQEPCKKRLVGTVSNKDPSAESKKEASPRKGGGNRRATSNHSKSPVKPRTQAGTQKITRFFANSS